MDDERHIADALEGIPHPALCHALAGHRKVASSLLGQYHSGRLHHAILLSGEKGIGKATLALRFAAHVLRHPDHETSPAGDKLETIDDTVQARIASGAHPNLLHLSRPWDPKTKKFRTKLTIDEIRQTVPFFGTSRAEKGWRIAVVDSIDDMNANASNALLKILEEPPRQTLFFVIANSMASVLPTIRSRCHHIPLKPLEKCELEKVLERFGVLDSVDPANRSTLVSLSRGSVRRGIMLARQNGMQLHEEFSAICANLGAPDWEKIHAMADKIATRSADDNFALLLDFANSHMEAMASGRANPDAQISTLARWAQVWEKTRNSVHVADGYNLDRKQVILNLFQDMGEAART